MDTANLGIDGRKVNLVALLVLIICRGEKRTNVCFAIKINSQPK